MNISNTIQSLELRRHEIDEEVQHAYDLVRELKTRRNTLAYISRLPTEIISKIFCILAHSCMDSGLSWIPSITAICSHWRAIALECPNLWSFIDFWRPNWVEEMLKRSKMAPLVIKADRLTHPIRPAVVDAIRLSLQHISRIKELRLVAPKGIIADLINPINKPAPLLQSLHLDDSRFYYAQEPFILSETHFVCGGHFLDRLELVNCNIPWESQLLCGLRHFRFTFDIHKARLPATQLLDALEKMPLLESLDFNSILPFPSSDTNRVVHLPHLQSLRLAYTVPDGAYLLNLVSFPVSTSLVVFARNASQIDYSSVCDAVSSVWNGKEGSQLLRCLIISCQSLSRRLEGWITADVHSSEPQIDVHLSWAYERDTDGSMIMINLCNALILTNLDTLFIYGSEIPAATWLCAFAHLTSLRTLHFCGSNSVFKLVSALSERLKDTDEVFLSGLRDLWLEDTDLGVSFGHINILKMLQDCLMTRCHRNAGLQGLHLRTCYHLSSEGVDLLREIVDVDWDGWMGG